MKDDEFIDVPPEINDLSKTFEIAQTDPSKAIAFALIDIAYSLREITGMLGDVKRVSQTAVKGFTTGVVQGMLGRLAGIPLDQTIRSIINTVTKSESEPEPVPVPDPDQLCRCHHRFAEHVLDGGPCSFAECLCERFGDRPRLQ